MKNQRYENPRTLQCKSSNIKKLNWRKIQQNLHVINQQRQEKRLHFEEELALEGLEEVKIQDNLTLLQGKTVKRASL